MALGVTRGAWLGLGVGTAVMLSVIALRDASRDRLGHGLAVAGPVAPTARHAG